MKKWLIGGILIASFLTGCLMWHNIDKWFNKDIDVFMPETITKPLVSFAGWHHIAGCCAPKLPGANDSRII